MSAEHTTRGGELVLNTLFEDEQVSEYVHNRTLELLDMSAEEWFALSYCEDHNLLDHDDPTSESVQRYNEYWRTGNDVWLDIIGYALHKLTRKF